MTPRGQLYSYLFKVTINVFAIDSSDFANINFPLYLIRSNEELPFELSILKILFQNNGDI